MVNLGFALAFGCELAVWFWLNRHFSMADDFMRRANRWLAFSLSLTIFFCLLFAVVIWGLDLQTSEPRLFLFLFNVFGNLPQSLVVIVVFAIIFSVLQMLNTLQELFDT